MSRDTSVVVQFTRKGLVEELIDAGEKGGKRLTGTGRSSNQNVSPRLNSRPSMSLNISGLTNLPVKPFGDEGVKERERHPGMLGCRQRRVKTPRWKTTTTLNNQSVASGLPYCKVSNILSSIERWAVQFGA